MLKGETTESSSSYIQGVLRSLEEGGMRKLKSKLKHARVIGKLFSFKSPVLCVG